MVFMQRKELSYLLMPSLATALESKSSGNPAGPRFPELRVTSF